MKLKMRKMENKEGIDAVFLHATEGILVTNGKGEIIRCNPSTEKLFGYSKGELEGKKIEMLIPQRFTRSHEMNRTNYSHNPRARSMGIGMELHGLKKDGSEFPVEISLSPYTFQEETYVVAFVLDITIRKKAEENLKNYSTDLERQVKNRTLVLEEAINELKKTKRELDISFAKEKELNEMKSRFVSMASHEFRTPLTTMLSSVSLITKYHEKNDTENHSKHIHKVKNSIKNLTDILNDFLSVSKLEEGKIENIPEEINLKQFISEISSEMQGMLAEDQKIVEEYTGREIVKVDPKILKNILFNLISNAIKFSPNDGVIELLVRTDDNISVIIVNDYGMGISQEDQKHLFERFFRGHNVTHLQGTGLGLSIVASYVKLMEGTIQVDSTQNKGTTFTISLKTT